MALKALIFDWDGVIADTLSHHVQWLKDFVGEHIEKEDVISLHDGNIFLNTESKLSQVDWFAYRDNILEKFLEVELKKEIIETVENLQKNYSLFVVSSGTEIGIKGILQKYNLDVFSEVLGNETHSSKSEKFKMIFEKYNLSKEDVLFVTDTLGDIKEAKESGIRTIAVTFGYHDRKRLERGNPFKIVDSFEEIEEIAQILQSQAIDL